MAAVSLERVEGIKLVKGGTDQFIFSQFMKELV